MADPPEDLEVAVTRDVSRVVFDCFPKIIRRGGQKIDLGVNGPRPHRAGIRVGVEIGAIKCWSGFITRGPAVEFMVYRVGRILIRC